MRLPRSSALIPFPVIFAFRLSKLMQGTPLEICIVPIPEDCVVLPLSPIHPVNNIRDRTVNVIPTVF